MSERETGSATRPLTQHDRPRLWERVVVERGKGERWRAIAERAGLSERQRRRIYMAHMRGAPTLERSELVRELETAITDYDSAIEQLALVSMTTHSDCARGRSDQSEDQRAHPQVRSAERRGPTA